MGHRNRLRITAVTTVIAALSAGLLAVPTAAVAAGVTNGMIAYETGASSYRIWTMNPDGSGRTALSLVDATYLVSPEWSPDGNWLLFVAGEVSQSSPDREFGGGLYKVRADGAQLTRLGDDTRGLMRWSPDGKLIAFGKDGRLHVMNADGTGVRPLPYPFDSMIGGFDWTPDGRIMFVGNEFVAPHLSFDTVYVAPLEGVPPGTVPEEVFTWPQDDPDYTGGLGGYGLDVSRDGTKILVPMMVSGPPPGDCSNPAPTSGQAGAYMELYSIDVASRGLRRITDTATFRGPEEQIAEWSPDGNRIVFQAQRVECESGVWSGYGPEIYVMNADGSGQTRLITDDDPEYYHYDNPSWQPCTSTTITCVSSGSAQQPAPSRPAPSEPAPSEPAPSQPGPSSGGPACPAGEVPEDGFVDVPSTNVHESAIDCLVWWEIASGVGGGRFAPDRPVTRDQMATFIARTMAAGGAQLPSDPPDRFSDDDGNPHESAINQLAALGVVSGTGTRSYSPSRTVNRDAMATFLVRAYEEAVGTTVTASRDYFSDDAGNVHESSINKSAEMAFASGTGAGRYSPAEAVRRDQMGSFLSRVLDAYVADGVSSPPSSSGGSGVQVLA